MTDASLIAAVAGSRITAALEQYARAWARTPHNIGLAAMAAFDARHALSLALDSIRGDEEAAAELLAGATPEQPPFPSADQWLLRLYADWSEETWRAGFMSPSALMIEQFREWLAADFADEMSRPLESYEAEMLRLYHEAEAATATAPGVEE